MRILIVCQYYHPERVSITPIAEDLARRGHDVTVVTGKPNYGLGEIPEEYRNLSYEERSGVKIHRVNLVARKKGKLSLIFNYLSFNRSSRKFLRRFKEDFDVVYSMSMSPVMSVQGAGEFAKKKGIPHVLHCLDLWPESAVVAGNVKPGSLFYKVLYRWSRKIYLSANKILISSPSFRDYFTNVLRMPGASISYVPQPPLIDKIPRKTPLELSKSFNLVYTGNVGKLQLVEEVVEALGKANPSKRIDFHVVGSGSNLELAKKAAKDAKIEDRVHFHGSVPVEEAAAYSAAADMILVSLKSGPSPVYKTIPNKLVSSLAYGKPILGLISGDGKELLNQIGGALLTDEVHLVEGLEKAASLSKEELESMGRRNKEAYEERFAFERILDQLESEIKAAR